jgi:hypothetical protein
VDISGLHRYRIPYGELSWSVDGQGVTLTSVLSLRERRRMCRDGMN